MKKIGIVTFDLNEFENVKKQVENLYKKYQSSLEIFGKRKDELSSLNIDLEKKEIRG